MDRLRLMLAWTVSGIWVVQTVAAAIPPLGYNPSPWVNTAFGMVMTFLFGGAIVSRWKNKGNH